MPINAVTTIKKEKNGMLSNEINARIKIRHVEKIIYFLRISSDAVNWHFNQYTDNPIKNRVMDHARMFVKYTIG